MSGLEICLVVIGIIVITISFIFAEQFQNRNGEEQLQKEKISEITDEIIRREVEAELAIVIDEKIEEVKKELNKFTTEKIMALGEYSDDVNLRINKNHEEVMFLYNMLNDKEVVVKNTIKDIEALKVSVKKMAIANDFATQAAEKKTDNIVSEENISEKEKAEESVVKADIQEEQQAVATDNGDKENKSKISVKKSNNNKKILELYNQGLSNIEIAKKLGLGVGEVRLVIDLFNLKK